MRKMRIAELERNIHVMGAIDAHKMAQPTDSPVVSIYVPAKHTERTERRDEWDKIEFKDLAKSAVGALEKVFGSADAAAPWRERLDFIEAKEDLPLWIDAAAGLAFFVTRDDAYVYNMSHAPTPCVVVANEFYIKPLLADEQLNMSYKLLLLNTDFFALLDGNYNSVHYEPLPDDVKNYFAETYPEFDGETTALDYYSLEDHASPYKDHKSRADVTAEEAAKFFRYVNHAMTDELVKDDPTPVILVCAAEHDHDFRACATFQTLLPEGIKKDPRSLSGSALRDAAREIMLAHKAADLAAAADTFKYALTKDKATADPAAAGLALAERKVEVLFADAERALAGTYDPINGKVELAGEGGEGGALPDLSCELINAAILQDAQVYVLPKEKMPADSAVCVTYRY